MHKIVCTTLEFIVMEIEGEHGWRTWEPRLTQGNYTAKGTLLSDVQLLPRNWITS